MGLIGQANGPGAIRFFAVLFTCQFDFSQQRLLKMGRRQFLGLSKEGLSQNRNDHHTSCAMAGIHVKHIACIEITSQLEVLAKEITDRLHRKWA